MTNAKRVNALLWTGNVILIIGIVAFAFQFLIFPEARAREVEAPISVPRRDRPQDPTDINPLSKLANPLTPVVPPPDRQAGPIKLIGTFRIKDDPTGDTAYLFLVSRNLNVNAYVGESIRDESAGQEISDLAGWKLKSVTPKTAIFTTPSGDVTLQLEEQVIASGPGPGNPLTTTLGLTGQAWEGGKYTSKKDANRSTDMGEVWSIDRKEVEWATANVDMILQGVALEPYSSGGLKITSLPEGTFGYDRGLRTGDVLKSVNGQGIDSPAKLNEVMRGLSKTTPSLTLMVDRAGRQYSLTYSIPRTPPGR